MHSRCLLQLLLALSSLNLSKTQDVIGSGLSCVRSSRADDGQTRVEFLREGTAGARSLYITLWSEDMQLVTCEVNPSPLITERYRALCDESSANGQDNIERFNISALLAPDARCALGSPGAPKFSRRAGTDGKEVKTRRKRAVIFPGTLWCGTGSRAARYDQLGMFENTDRCCREHDHCRHIIPAFTGNYGVFNSKFFTVSHCDCDQRFRQCLLSVNDTISSMVGYSFFNFMQVLCFELKQQKRCTEMYWWGMCKAANMAPYAVFRSALPYNSSDVTSKYVDSTDSNKMTISEGQHITESPAISTKSPKSEHRCSSREPPRGDTFHRRRKKKKGCKRHQKLSTVAPFLMPPVSKINTTTPSTTTSLFNAFNSSTLVSNKKRAGKKKGTRKSQLAHPKHKSPHPLPVTTNSYLQTTSATQSIPPLTQRPLLQTLVLTDTAAATKTTKRHRKVPKHRRCCGFRKPLRGEAFQLQCKKCQDGKQKRTTRMTTVTPSTTLNGLPMKEKILTKHQQKKETAKQQTLKKIQSRDSPATLKPAPSAHKDSQLLSNSTNPESKGRTKTQITPAERGLTDNHLLCGSLKHLDKCENKIPPLEKKYGLQNKDSKTAYHCECTSRLALQIESFSQPSILPTVIMDYVSQFCFKLPREKKCYSKKSCSGGFTKASDLLRALKKIDEKDTAGVRNSLNDRKRGIPVRLSKRCLRLQREADITAQLKRL